MGEDGPSAHLEAILLDAESVAAAWEVVNVASLRSGLDDQAL
jgi:hypothetical protein